MTLAAMPLHEGMSRPPVPAGPGPLPGEDLVALAVSAGAEDPDVAAGRVFAAADGSRHRLTAARSLLIERLKLRSTDLEAAVALRIVEGALARTPYPGGPWLWTENLSPRRLRAVERRRRRTVRRRRTGPRLPGRRGWRGRG